MPCSTSSNTSRRCDSEDASVTSNLRRPVTTQGGGGGGGGGARQRRIGGRGKKREQREGCLRRQARPPRRSACARGLGRAAGGDARATRRKLPPPKQRQRPDDRTGVRTGGDAASAALKVRALQQLAIAVRCLRGGALRAPAGKTDAPLRHRRARAPSPLAADATLQRTPAPSSRAWPRHSAVLPPTVTLRRRRRRPARGARGSGRRRAHGAGSRRRKAAGVAMAAPTRGGWPACAEDGHAAWMSLQRRAMRSRASMCACVAATPPTARRAGATGRAAAGHHACGHAAARRPERLEATEAEARRRPRGARADPDEATASILAHRAEARGADLEAR